MLLEHPDIKVMQIFKKCWTELSQKRLIITSSRNNWRNSHASVPITLIPTLRVGDFFERDGQHWLRIVEREPVVVEGPLSTLLLKHIAASRLGPEPDALLFGAGDQPMSLKQNTVHATASGGCVQ